MGNVMLGWVNQVKAASLTPSTAAPGLGAEQLRNDQGSAYAAWQTQAVTNQYLVVDAGASVSWRAFGLFKTNFTSAAGVRCYTRLANGTVTFDSAGTPGTLIYPAAQGFGQYIIVAPGEVQGRYLNIDISDATNPDGFINIPLIFAGPVLQLERNFDYQSSIGRTNQLNRADTRAGGAIFRSDWIKRTFDLSLSSLTPTEMIAMQDMDLVARQGSNVLLLPNPNASTLNREAVFGEMLPGSSFGYVSQSGLRRSYRATITERL